MAQTAWRAVQSAARVAEEAIFPGRCVLCGTWLTGVMTDRAPVCGPCREALEWIREPRCQRCGIELISERETCMRCRNSDFAFDSNMSLFSYIGRARRLLACLKFERRTRLAPWFAGLITEALRQSGWVGVIVPVPSRPDRRSPDAVELVARVLQRRYGLLVDRWLTRTGGPQQKSLNYEQRRANLDGKVLVRKIGRHENVPAHAILLDDVFTTGATLDACARVLRAGGCGDVRAITLVMEE